MTVEELRERLGSDVFVRTRTEGAKRLVECGVEVPWTDRKKGYTKSIVFNAESIPENAVEKIKRVIV